MLFYINECIDVNTALKIPSNLWVVRVGYISFQEISYAGKPQVVSSYILSNLQSQILDATYFPRTSLNIVTLKNNAWTCAFGLVSPWRMSWRHVIVINTLEYLRIVITLARHKVLMEVDLNFIEFLWLQGIIGQKLTLYTY
jgi:hypothetical protein